MGRPKGSYLDSGQKGSWNLRRADFCPESRYDPFALVLRLFVPPRFPTSGAARRLGHTDWFKKLGRGAITAEEIARTPERFVVLFRQSMREGLFGRQLPQRTTCIFSYWPGYLSEPRLQLLDQEVKAAVGRMLKRHASGHAHPDDLRRFVEDVNPRRLVPVHTTSPETWARWWPTTKIAEDGKPLVL